MPGGAGFPGGEAGPERGHTVKRGGLAEMVPLDTELAERIG